MRFREDGMDFDKDNFEEENELAPLEEDRGRGTATKSPAWK